MSNVWTRPRQALAAAAGLAVVGLLAGCDGGPQTGTVAGKVTLDGKAVTAGVVSFVGKDGGTPVAAFINADGTYRVSHVPAGEVVVSVSALPAEDAGDVIKKSGQTPEKGPPPESKPPVPLPARYADPGTSGLATTVKADKDGVTQYDIPMTK